MWVVWSVFNAAMLILASFGVVEDTQHADAPSTPVANCFTAPIPSLKPLCFAKTSLGITKSFQLCLLRSLSVSTSLLRPGLPVGGLITELGADADVSLVARSSFSGGVTFLRGGEGSGDDGFARIGLDGDPRTVSSLGLGLSFDDDELFVPNLNPPLSLRLCFLLMLEILFKVLVAYPPTLGDVIISSVFQPSSLQSVDAVTCNGAGKAETGRPFFLRLGVLSLSSRSSSVSASLISGLNV